MSNRPEHTRQHFCVMPFINLHVAADGGISPCCEFDGSVGNLKNLTLADAWNGPDLSSIRDRFADDRPVAACWKCFDREAGEKDSMRQQMNDQFNLWFEQLQTADEIMSAIPPSPAALDVRLSNLCNFKCRSCWHGASSKWFTDARALGLTVADKPEFRSFDSAAVMLDQMSGWIQNLETIHFAGGEPLLMEEHYRILTALLDAGRTNIRLTYNTNLSVTGLGDWSALDLWRRFEDVHVRASVDDTQARGALIRHGFDWATFVANVRQVRARCPHVWLDFGITVSALNIATLDDLLAALHNQCGATSEEIFLHSLQSPDFMRTQVLPARQKRRIADRLRASLAMTDAPGMPPPTDKLTGKVEGVLSYMMAKNLTHELPKLVKRMDALDRLRSESTAETLPDLAAAMQSGRGITGLLFRARNTARLLFGSR